MSKVSNIAKLLREYADYRATPDDLSRLLFLAADRQDELLDALRDMLTEFDDGTITDDIRTHMGMSAITVKVLQRARTAVAKATAA